MHTLVRDINEGRPDRYLPIAAMIGHFFLHPPARIHNGRDNYLERCLDYFRGTLDCANFDAPVGYCSKEDFFVDLLAIGALFSAVSGWQRLSLDTELELPLFSWTLMTSNSQRLWVQTLLALLFVHYTLGLDLSLIYLKLRVGVQTLHSWPRMKKSPSLVSLWRHLRSPA